MSNENAPRIFKHADDRHVQTRLDYMLIYRSEGKAKIIRILETWMDTKYAESFKGTADSKEQGTEPPDEDLWVTMSYDQFSLFVYGTIQHDTIKQQVDELVASKHVERRIHPVYPYGPPQYRLNRELVQKSLDELEIPGNLFDLLPMFVTPRKKRTPQEEYPHPGGKNTRRDPGKIPPGTGESSYPSNNNTKNTKNPSKNGDTYGDGKQNSTAQIGTDVPTPARDASSDSHESPTEDTNGTTDGNSDHSRCDQPSATVGTGDHPQSPAGHPGSSVRLPAARTDQAAAEGRATDGTGPARAGSTGDGVARGQAPGSGYRQDEQQNEVPPRGKGGRARKAPAEPPLVFTPEGQKVYDAWASLFKSPPPVGPQTIKCANELYARLMPWCQELHLSCKLILKEIKSWLYTTDPDWYRSKGVALCDINTKFERWQSVKTEELERASKPANKPREQSIIEKLRAEQERYAPTGGTHV